MIEYTIKKIVYVVYNLYLYLNKVIYAVMMPFFIFQKKSLIYQGFILLKKTEIVIK